LILIVDDHADGCNALVTFLKMDGFEAMCIHSGEKALAWLATSLPAVMLLDDFMPGLDGLDVMLELRKHSRYDALPIIFYSAGEDLSRRALALSLGAIAWIAKGKMNLTDVALQIEALVPPDSAPLAA
jgi:DNA-binding response OmpR family regulator